MRSSITSFVVLGAACLVEAEKKKCSSVFPSTTSSLSVRESATVSSYVSSSVGSSSSNVSYSPSVASSATIDSTLESLSTSGSLINSLTTTSTDQIPTVTSPAAATASSSAVVVVANDVGNGNFGSYDASRPGGIADWDSQHCEINLDYGYQGDGSLDTGCVQMTTTTTTAEGRANKREDYTAMIEQYLEDVDETANYSIRFWYTILSNTLADTCRMEAYYGDVLLTQSAYFDVITDTVFGNTPWVELVDEVVLSSSDGYIRFQLSCVGDGTAVVFLDEVFVSNKIDATSSDNISLLFTSTGSVTSSISITTITTSTSTSELSNTVETISSTSIESSSTSSSATTSSVPASSSATTSSSTSSITSTSTATTTQSSTVAASGVPTVCVTSAEAAATAGLTCGRTVYSNVSPYKMISVTDITRNQCAAACVADSKCLSISYYSQQTCNSVCFLLSTSVAGTAYSYVGGGVPQVWDKGCFTQTACAEPAADQVCLDKIGSSPASTCKATFAGKAKSCASPFATATVSGLCGSGACMQLCKQYPSCKTYSATYGGSVTCNFYSGDIDTIADSGSSSTIFSDMSCFECGSGSSVFNWLSPLSDPATMPDLSACIAGSQTTLSSTLSSSLLPSSTSSSAITISSSTSSITTTTTASSSSSATSSASCITCLAAPSSVASHYTCGVQGDYTYQDAYGVNTGRQDSMMDCAAICAQDSSCSAYGYRANSNIYYGCAFIHTSLQDAGFYPSSLAGYFWSDMGCASCGDSCSSTSSTSSLAASASVTPSVSTTLSTSTLSADQTTTSSTSASSSTSATATCSSVTARLEQGVSCGLPGSNGSSAVAPGVNFEVGSLSSCASRCLIDVTCLSFSFSTDRMCLLFTTSMVDDALSYDPSSTTWYYDEECFSCS